MISIGARAGPKIGRRRGPISHHRTPRITSVFGSLIGTRDHPIRIESGYPDHPAGRRRAGGSSEVHQPGYTPAEHCQVNLDIARLMENQPVPGLRAIPANVIACNFWLMAADSKDPNFPILVRPCRPFPGYGSSLQELNTRPAAKRPSKPRFLRRARHPLQHYLLLPTFEWGIADWHLDVIRPFVKKYLPTIGFSLDDAVLARDVTVIGNDECFLR